MEEDDRDVLDPEAYELHQLLSERLGPRGFTDELGLPWDDREVNTFDGAVSRLFARLQKPAGGSARSRRRAQTRTAPAAATQTAE